MNYALGKTPASHSVSFAFGDFFDVRKLPVPPAVFGHQAMFKNWGMMGNDRYGCCVLADAAHQAMLWTAKGGHSARFTTDNVLEDYSALTGFRRDDPSTDQGTDMGQAAAYRRKIGVIDAKRQRHQTDAYVSLRTANLPQLFVASWLMEAASVGIQLPDNAERLFDDGKVWTVDPHAEIVGGHCITVLGRDSDDNIVFLTWGGTARMTQAFYERYTDEANVSFSIEMMQNNMSAERFDADGLRKQITLLAKK